jgi:hypothetical protein
MWLISILFYFLNHVFLHATTCSLRQFDEKLNHIKILKFWNFHTKIARKMILLLNHLASFLYSLGSNFIILNVCQKHKK